MLVPVQPCLRPHYEARLSAVLEPDRSGWPAPASAFARFVTAEATVMGINYISLGTPPLYGAERQLEDAPLVPRIAAIPGILIEPEISERLGNLTAPTDTERREHQIELVHARQGVSASRLADDYDVFRPSATLPLNALDELAEVAPDRVAPQAAMLLVAIANGWDIRMIERGPAESIMPQDLVMSAAMSLQGGKPHFVYQEVAGKQPVFTKDRAVVRRVTAAQHMELAMAATPRGLTIGRLYEYGGALAERLVGPQRYFPN